MIRVAKEKKKETNGIHPSLTAARACRSASLPLDMHRAARTPPPHVGHPALLHGEEGTMLHCLSNIIHKNYINPRFVCYCSIKSDPSATYTVPFEVFTTYTVPFHLWSSPPVKSDDLVPLRAPQALRGGRQVRSCARHGGLLLEGPAARNRRRGRRRLRPRAVARRPVRKGGEARPVAFRGGHLDAVTRARCRRSRRRLGRWARGKDCEAGARAVRAPVSARRLPASGGPSSASSDGEGRRLQGGYRFSPTRVSILSWAAVARDPLRPPRDGPARRAPPRAASIPVRDLQRVRLVHELPPFARRGLWSKLPP
jgi:hypothetical protein